MMVFVGRGESGWLKAEKEPHVARTPSGSDS